MRKILTAVLLIATLTNVFAVSAFAVSASSNEIETKSVVVNEDGSTTYYHDNGTATIVSPVEIVSDLGVASLNSAVQTTGAGVDILGKVDATNVDKKTGAVNWVYTLRAYFNYVEGVSSTCTLVTYDYSISDTSWSFSNGRTDKSGNIGYGYGTMTNKFLFFTSQTVDIALRICCDVYGNLSS